MRLPSSTPIGRPSLDLSADEIATVVDLLCKGAASAKEYVTPGMLEVPMTVLVRKSMRAVKRGLGVSNLEVGGEHELLDEDVSSAKVKGRIDIVLKFLHQFGDEDAYIACECKRLADGQTQLSQKYVEEGVQRFVGEKYSAGHSWGLMLGMFVLLPHEAVVKDIGDRVVAKYGVTAKLKDEMPHPSVLQIQSGALVQANSSNSIRIIHVFSDMVALAA